MTARKRRLAALGTAALGMTIGLAAVPGVAHAAGATLYVAPGGSSANADTSCATAAYTTISSAVGAAPAGSTINICPGTYAEAVTISEPLTLNGSNGGPAIINAAGKVNGISIMGPATAGTTVEGLTVENAVREGITIGGTTNITISGNTVTNNDLMCQPQTTEDDCGEGVDLEAVTNSTITGNTVSHNAGGILVSDGIPAKSIGASAFGATTPFSGPTSGNTISNNVVLDNIWDCGITMPSHNSFAMNANGTPNATAGGVFGNTVTGNTVTGNGTAGGGGVGILLAGPFPGTAVYNNTIQGNTVSGNGEPGIVMHSHAPNQDLNGNKVLNNTVGVNGVGESQPGVGVYSTASSQGDAGSGLPATAGIEFFSAVVPVQGTVIQGNTITGDYYGVWLYNTAAGSVSGNKTSNVKVGQYNVPPVGSGYWIVARNGAVANYGHAPFWGAATGLSPSSPVVGTAVTPDGGGYWIATANGGVFSYGDATFYGSLGGVKLNKPIVGITGTADGHGYWLVASDGGVFSFGDASFHGSTGGIKLVKPVVGIAPTPSGGGYWLVASDGGVFSFGDASFHGSTGGVKLLQPIVGMTASITGGGYWLVASDGGVFNFGDAGFFGSAGGNKLGSPVVGISTAQPYLAG